MGKAIHLSASDQPQAVVDLDRLAMIEFSQTGRQMLVRYSDGDAARFESGDRPFDIARIARMVQVNAHGFEACDNSAIIGLNSVKYAITETPDTRGQTVLSLGMTGQKRVDMIVSAQAATHIVARMNRQRPTLNCQLTRGQKLHMYPSALMLASHKTGSDVVTLDFADTGTVAVQPLATDKGFLTSAWSGMMAGIFISHESGLCAGVVERIGFQNDGLQFVKHAHGVAVVARSAVQKVSLQDYPDDLPGMTLDLAVGSATDTAAFSFETAGQRDHARAGIAAGKPVAPPARPVLKF